jgi:hypothetical protein
VDDKTLEAQIERLVEWSKGVDQRIAEMDAELVELSGRLDRLERK